MTNLININEVYLHILDLASGTKVFSENPMSLEPVVLEYMHQHIESFFEGLDVGKTQVPEESKLGKMMAAEDFKTFSLQVTDAFLHAMEKSEDIKPCDLAVVLFEKDEREFAAVLKLNFKPSYAHYVHTDGQVITNNIIRHMTTLPPMTQKIDEGFLVALHDYMVWVKDKWVQIDGKKCRYITEEVMGIKPVTTPKKAISEMTKAAEKIVEKYQDNPRIEAAKVRTVIESMIDHNGQVEAAEIVQKCFETKAEKEAFEEVMTQKGLNQSAWEVPESQKGKIRRTQKIKTSSGVEIVVPYAYMARCENIEIINHPDGSVSIQLKNLGELI